MSGRDGRVQAGLCSVTLAHCPPSHVVSMAASSGLEGIEWSGGTHVPAGSLDSARHARTLCKDAGIEVVSYGSYFHAGIGQHFGPTMETALELGAPLIRVWAGPRGTAPDAAGEALRTRCVEELQAACDAAAEHGLLLGLEFHRQTLTEGEQSTLALLSSVDRSNLLTYWQPLPGVSARAAAQQLRGLAPFLAHLHVFQWDEKLERHPLETGERFWAEVLQSLPRRHAKVPTWALLEFLPHDDSAQLHAEACLLRNWLHALAPPG